MSGAGNRLCLVTGGAGFIGSHTVDALLKAGYRIRILDILQPRVHPNGKPAYVPDSVDFRVGDASDKATLAAALDGVTHVVHLAAYQDYLPDFSTFIHVNTESTALLFEIIVENQLPIEKVVVASSQAVYGEGHYTCATHGVVYPKRRSEEQMRRADWEPPCPACGDAVTWRPTTIETVSPHNQYAVSKYAQEMIALVLGERYQIPTVAMRYSIVQGPRQSFYNAYSGACRIFNLSYYFKQQPVIYEDGQQVRDYVNIHDVVAANLLVLEDSRANYRAFNVGGDRPYTVCEFAAIVAQEYGIECLPQIPCVYRFGDTRHILSDVSELRALGWKPTRTPVDSVREYANWLRQQQNIEDIRSYAEQHMKSLNVLRSANV